MRKYFTFLTLVLLLVPGLLWGSAALMGISGGGVPSTVGGQTILDDFTAYAAAEAHLVGAGGNWTELSGAGATHVDTVSDNLDTDTSESFSLLYTTTELDTLTQYVAITLVTNGDFHGIYFRSTNNAVETAYCVRRSAANNLLWRYCTGHDCTDIQSCDPNIDMYAGDSFGIRVTGTGNDTEVEVWSWDGQDAPAVTGGDVNAAWGACDCTLTTNPGTAADTGKYTGLYNGGSDPGTLDTFRAGDSTN